MNRRQALVTIAGSAAAFAGIIPAVKLERVPKDGIQPQAIVDDHGALHLLWYEGDAHAGDLFYSNGGQPLRVNSLPGTAIAAGSIRGAQMALGPQGSVHVAWNGAKQHSPMYYARMEAKAFEPQRSVMTLPSNLDGGGSLAADASGNVFVLFHNGDGTGEAHRKVYVAASHDNGAKFAPEKQANPAPTGACGCCDMKLFASRKGELYALYRSAVEGMHRDIYLLKSTDSGRTFTSKLLHKWDINACPMTSMDIVETPQGNIVGAWETAGQVFFANLNNPSPAAAPGEGKGRKHPRLAVNHAGDMLMVWTEGTGFNRGGSLAWQLYNSSGQSVGDTHRQPGIPASSFAAPVAAADGGFRILY